MRRNDREIAGQTALRDLLDRCPVCRLGLSDDGQPYVVPLCFGYRWDAPDLTLYFHCARTGRKLGIIARNSRVCVEFDRPLDVRIAEHACQWSMAYESAIGDGVAALVDDPDERAQALDCIMQHYSGRSDWSYDPHTLAATAIIRVQVRTLSGKRLPSRSQ